MILLLLVYNKDNTYTNKTIGGNRRMQRKQKSEKDLITAETERKILAANFRALMKSKNVTQSEVSRALDVPQPTVSSWANATKYPRIDALQKLADYFGVLRSDLTSDGKEQVTPKSFPVPILGEIACGTPIFAEQNTEGYIYETSQNVGDGKHFYLKAKGKSMEPTIPDGSYVLFRYQNVVENGEIAAVLMENENEATLKRVKYVGDFVMLMPENNEYNPMIVNEENPVRIIGKALNYRKDLV